MITSFCERRCVGASPGEESKVYDLAKHAIRKKIMKTIGQLSTKTPINKYLTNRKFFMVITVDYLEVHPRNPIEAFG